MRLFSFGCSFTRYQWPTWADIAAQEFDYSENWGLRGAGNNYILNSLIECDIKNKITADDVVCIQWSAVLREDRYVNGHWLVAGNIFSPQRIYDQTFIDRLVDVRGCYVRDLAIIYSAQKILDSIGCRYIFINMLDIDDVVSDVALNRQDDALIKNHSKTHVDDLLTAYKSVLDFVRPSVYKTIFNNDWSSRPWYTTENFKKLNQRYMECAGPDWPTLPDLMNSTNLASVPREVMAEIYDSSKWDWATSIRRVKRHDPHPTPNEHLEYIDIVMPEFTVSKYTRDLVNQIDQRVRTFQDHTDLSGQLNVNYPSRW